MHLWIDYLVVGLSGAFVGCAELVSRYRDNPGKALQNISAGIYICFNVLVSILALGLIHAFDISVGLDATTDPDKVRWVQILIAGFGAIMFFRSSFFVYRVGDQDVSIGPGALISIMLTAADRSVDRRRAEDRASLIKKIMRGISFEKASDPLPTVAIALMQNLPRDDQETILTQIQELKNNPAIPREVKPFPLGLSLMDFLGADVLKAAVSLIREWIELEKEESDTSKSETDLQPLVDFVESEIKKTSDEGDVHPIPAESE